MTTIDGSFDLDAIAARLEGLEETVINRLIDRAQFSRNDLAYRVGASEFANAPADSLFDLRLRRQEEMDAAFGRFRVPEERPFHRDLPPAERSVRGIPQPFAAMDCNVANVTLEIVAAYLRHLDKLCAPGDDGQFGSSVEHDVAAIQAIARRVHFGALYVAESKYRRNPDAFRQMCAAEDRPGLLRAIERPEVEERILRRVAEKVRYVQANVNTKVRRVVDVDLVLVLYRDVVIPLTKEGELRYLLATKR